MQSKPTKVEKAVIRNWCETIQTSGVPYGQVSQFEPLPISAAPSQKKKMGMLG
jgi:hypothetical protein